MTPRRRLSGSDSSADTLIDEDLPWGARMRARAVGAVLSTGPLRRVVDRLVLHERYLKHLLVHKVLQYRLLNNAELRLDFTNLILQPRLFPLLGLHGRLLDGLLGDERFIERASLSSDFVDRILDAEPVIEQLMEDPSILEHALKAPSAVTHIARDTPFIDLLLHHNRVVERSAGDPAFLDRLFKQESVIDYAARNETYVGHFLDQNRVFEQIARDGAYVDRLLQHGAVFDRIVENDAYVDKLLGHRKVYGRILSDDRTLGKLAQSGRMFEAVVHTPRFTERLVANKAALETVLFHPRVLEHEGVFKRLIKSVEFEQELRKIRPHIRWNDDTAERALRIDRGSLHKEEDVQRALLSLFCEGDEAHLAHGTLRFPDAHALWATLHEILVDEEYYFEAETSRPRILDCGAHCGLATYYFKSLYPAAVITAFEPNPAVRELAEANIARNGYEDVDVLPYALSDAEGEVVLYLSDVDSMAGSLTERRREWGDTLTALSVPARPLSDYLQEPIDLLKLDVEGVEDVVLREAEAHLGNVRNLVCEYHEGSGLRGDRLPHLLSLLQAAGFDVQVGKSYYYHLSSGHRPLEHVGRPYSLLIWARRQGRG